MSAPLFLNVQPQAGSPAASSKGGLPSLASKGKHGKQKGSSAKGRAADKAPPLAVDSAHLKYTVQEVSKRVPFAVRVRF